MARQISGRVVQEDEGPHPFYENYSTFKQVLKTGIIPSSLPKEGRDSDCKLADNCLEPRL